MSDHWIAVENREAKAQRLANAILVLHKALAIPMTPAAYAELWPQAVWDSVAKAIGEPYPPKTSIPIALALLEAESLEVAS